MKRLLFVLVLASVAVWSARPAAYPITASLVQGAAAAGRLIEVTALEKGGKFLFEPSVINAKNGETLHVRMKSVSTTMAAMPKMAMSHNFVLLKPGTAESAFVMSAIMSGFPNEYLPTDKKDIVASTSLAGTDETVDVTFKVPAAGTYPFVCSFPGHWAGGMKGTLVAK